MKGLFSKRPLRRFPKKKRPGGGRERAPDRLIKERAKGKGSFFKVKEKW